MRRQYFAVLCFAGLGSLGCRAVTEPTPAIDWRPWSAAVFAEAKQGGRLVLLDLGATWCHWCHVMEATTYADADVRGLLARHFVAVDALAARLHAGR